MRTFIVYLRHDLDDQELEAATSEAAEALARSFLNTRSHSGRGVTGADVQILGAGAGGEQLDPE